MASSKLSSGFRIHWAELRFPPLNLWVMAASVSSKGNAADTQKKSISAPSKSSRALQKLHRRLETLLAVRGGKV